MRPAGARGFGLRRAPLRSGAVRGDQRDERRRARSGRAVRLPHIAQHVHQECARGDPLPASRVDRGFLRGHPAQRVDGPCGQPARSQRVQLRCRRGLCVVAGRLLLGSARARDGLERYGALRRGRHDDEPFCLPLLQQDPGPQPARSLPALRPERRRDHHRRGFRIPRSEKARRCRTGRGQDLRRGQRNRRVERRQGQGTHRAAARGAGDRPEARLREGRIPAGHGRPRRRPRNRHAGGRGGRGLRAQGGLRRGRLAPEEYCCRIGQVVDRPPQIVGGSRQPAQGDQGAAPQGRTAHDRRGRAQLDPAGQPLLRESRGASVDPRYRRPPAPRGGEQLRLRRNELSRGARGIHRRLRERLCRGGNQELVERALPLPGRRRGCDQRPARHDREGPR